ncbi:M23 family metallopeptidase [Candidatus Uhrbacteria bacterium]|nr:M23 family metallopeptidase [Candidatus Uhrbacteria bacterium]
MKTRLSLFVLLFLLILIGCRASVVIEDAEPSNEQSLIDCNVGKVLFPTLKEEEFNHLYQNRDFLTDGNHLGRDIKLPEGRPIYPVACGTLRVYRPASGYGTLVAVVEHRLEKPKRVRNGIGSEVEVTGFLSIYGHLRPTHDLNGKDPLPIKAGDSVSPDTMLGYVENDAKNGDGAEHLHFGIRLQSMSDAAKVDMNWFRGYDTTPSQRRWFASPAEFLTTLMTSDILVRSHPAGTLLQNRSDLNQIWMVGPDLALHKLSPDDVWDDHLVGRYIIVPTEELSCYANGSPYTRELTDTRVIKFDDAPAVYEIRDQPEPKRYAFISEEAFSSWGWESWQIVVRPANERPFYLAHYLDRGLRRMRDGTLVKGRGQSETCIVSNGQRLPIFNWPTFVALGYQTDDVIEVDPSVLNAVTYPRGPMLTPQTIAQCLHHPSGPVIDLGTPDFSMPRDLGVSQDLAVPKDLNLPMAPSTDLAASPKDLGVPIKDMAAPVPGMPEVCNGADDDGNGQIDEIFLCPLGKHGANCVTVCGANGYRVCQAPNCDWSLNCHPFTETCDNTIDDDCDGKVDCADADCLASPACQKPVDMGMNQPPGIRYEFRVLDQPFVWQANEPYVLYDEGWQAVNCQNTGSTKMEAMANHWYRCDAKVAIDPFVGNFFSKAHPDWGFKGNLATIGNFPQHCTPTPSVEWRLTNLPKNQLFFSGSVDQLPCVTFGPYDFHSLPAYE